LKTDETTIKGESTVRGFAVAVLAALDDAGVAPGENFYVESVGKDLSGPGQSRRGDDRTSRLAAMTVARESQRGRVLIAIKELGPSTASEIESASRIDFRTVTPRIGELLKLGYIKNTDITRTSPYGKPQRVRQLTAKGEAWFTPKPGRKIKK
jgi:hypothetical protein